MRGGDTLFPNAFGEDLFVSLYVCVHVLKTTWPNFAFCAYRLWPWFGPLASTHHGLHASAWSLLSTTCCYYFTPVPFPLPPSPLCQNSGTTHAQCRGVIIIESFLHQRCSLPIYFGTPMRERRWGRPLSPICPETGCYGNIFWAFGKKNIASSYVPSCLPILKIRRASVWYILRWLVSKGTIRKRNKSSPKSFGKSVSLPHVGVCTLPLRVLAVACTMRNEALRSVAWRYGTLRNRYGKYRLSPSLI